jgi:predicted AAA+ superfamily ATPase
LQEGINQSLAGRTAILKLLPFSLKEISRYKESMSIDELIWKGFYPRVYDKHIPPHQAYSDYFETYIERDLRNFENIRNIDAFRLFVKLCAGRVGQLLNLSNLFENMVVADVLKWRWNHGKSNNLSFYRDSNGNEVDLIYEVGGKPIAIEIKSGKTISEDYFKDLRRFTKETNIKSKSILLYAGDIEQDRSDIKIINYQHLPDILETIN